MTGGLREGLSGSPSLSLPISPNQLVLYLNISRQQCVHLPRLALPSTRPILGRNCPSIRLRPISVNCLGCRALRRIRCFVLICPSYNFPPQPQIHPSILRGPNTPGPRANPSTSLCRAGWSNFYLPARKERFGRDAAPRYRRLLGRGARGEPPSFDSQMHSRGGPGARPGSAFSNLKRNPYS